MAKLLECNLKNHSTAESLAFTFPFFVKIKVEEHMLNENSISDSSMMLSNN